MFLSTTRSKPGTRHQTIGAKSINTTTSINSERKTKTFQDIYNFYNLETVDNLYGGLNKILKYISFDNNTRKSKDIHENMNQSKKG